MKTNDVTEQFDQLADRLPPPGGQSLEELRGRVARRRRTRTVSAAAGMAAGVAALIGVTQLVVLPSTSVVSPSVDDPWFGPTLGEVRVCVAEDGCGTTPEETALEEVESYIAGLPDIDVVLVETGEQAARRANRELQEAMTRPGEAPPDFSPAGDHVAPPMRFLLHETRQAADLTRKLATHPLIQTVEVWNGDQPRPALIRPVMDAPSPSSGDRQLVVPLTGTSHSLSFDVWDAGFGYSCFWIRGGDRALGDCRPLTIQQVEPTDDEFDATSSLVIEDDVFCFTSSYSLGIDRVRMELADGTPLRVVSAPVNPALPLTDIAIGCWSGETQDAQVEAIADDGTVVWWDQIDGPTP